MATAGELLAKMMLARENGENMKEIQKDFEEQSKRQLGGYCSEFSFGGNPDYVQPEE